METELAARDVLDAMVFARLRMRKHDWLEVLNNAVSVSVTQGVSVTFKLTAGHPSTSVEVHDLGGVRWRDSVGELHREGGMPASYGKHYMQWFEHGVEKLCLDDKGMVRFDGANHRSANGTIE